MRVSEGGLGFQDSSRAPAPLQSGSRLETGGLELTNNYAFNPSMVNMPRDDFTVEFWAKTPKYSDRTSGNSFQSFFSYATHTEKDSTCKSAVHSYSTLHTEQAESRRCPSSHWCLGRCDVKSESNR